ncbi:MAG: hypothetical protein ACPGVT_05315 [Maricaulaceae bacterium]
MMLRALSLPALLIALSACSGQSEQTRAGEQASLAAEPVINHDVSAPPETASIFKDELEPIREAGAMVLKIKTGEIQTSGFMSRKHPDDVIVFTDPTCESCMDMGQLLKDKGLSHVIAPVAFYSENGLERVGSKICADRGFDDPSDNCDALVSGMVKNTSWLMRHGIVDLPVVVMPNGWMVEKVRDPSDLSALLSETSDG